MRARLKLGLTALVWVAVMTLLKACGPTVVSATETSRTICRELRADLPTYSTRDTAETLKSGARFVTVFNAICED
ncbi:MAG TPA: hypothetical protein VGC40_10190 [Paenirhodobacter sp.]